MKYGWDNFTHEIYAENLTQQSAEKIEQILIAKYKSKDRRYGYNHTDGGDGTKGYIPSEESRMKMSISRTGVKNYWFGKHLTKEAKLKMSEARKKLCQDYKVIEMMRKVNPNKKPVYQYDKNKNLVKIWDSRHQAENEFLPNKKALAIGKCCQGDCVRAYGHYWTYEKLNSQTPLPYAIHERKVYQYDMDEKLLRTWDDLRIAVNSFRTGKTSTVICQCVSGHRPHAYGYLWSYTPIESEVV